MTLRPWCRHVQPRLLRTENCARHDYPAKSLTQAVAAFCTALAVSILACSDESVQTTATPLSLDADTPVAHLRLDGVRAAPEGNDSIALYFRALDAYHENVDLIDLSGLAIEEDGEILSGAVNLAELRNAENEGLAVVVAIDYSNVTADGGALKQTQRALLELVNHIDASGWNRHGFAVVGFANDRIEVVSFSASAEEARSAIKALKPDPEAFSAALFDGLDYAIQLIRKNSEIPHRSLVFLISDGRHSLEERDPENAERFIQPQRRIDAVLTDTALAEAHGQILIHSIGHPIPPWHEQHIELLDHLSSATGGEYLRTRHPDELGALLLGIWDDADRSLKAIVPTEMDGKPHRLRLRIGRRASEVRVVSYPSHFKIGPGTLFAGLGLLVLTSLGGLVIFLRRPGRLILTTAEQSGQTFRLGQGQTRIGSAADNDIQLVDDSLSDHHALIVINGRTVYIEDHSLDQSTFVNGDSTQRRALDSGDRIRLGVLEARFER